MRCAVVVLLIVVSLTGLIRADEPTVYRGQTTAEWLTQLSHPSASARAAAAQAFVRIGTRNEESVQPLIGLLQDRDARVRFYAAYALGKVELRPKQCIAALMKALPDIDEHVRYTSQWSLAQIAEQVAESNDGVQPLDEMLLDLLAEAETELMVVGALPGHLKKVQAAIASFESSTLQPTETEPMLVEAGDENDATNRFLSDFASDDLFVQIKAIGALRELDPSAVQSLLTSPETIENLDPAMGWHLSRAIAGFGEPIVPALTTALQHPSDEIRELAAAAMKELGPVAKIALPELVTLLDNDKTPDDVKELAIRAIIDLGPLAADATDLLLQHFSDPESSDSIRENAAEALGAIGPEAKRAVPSLLARLTEDETLHYLRSKIISALVRIDPKSEEVTQVLVATFRDSDGIYSALDTAEQLCKCGEGAKAILPQLIEAVDETSFEDRVRLLEMITKLSGRDEDDASPLLFQRLVDPTEDLMVQVAAARLLGTLGPTAVRRVTDELETGDEANQLIAARALVEMGAAASPAKDLLLELLKDNRNDTELRALAAVALGQLEVKASDAAPALLEILYDSEADNYLRSMCAVAFGQIDPSAASQLEARLEDTPAEVQIAAAYALCRMTPQHPRGLPKLVHWLSSDEYRGAAIKAIIDVGEVSTDLVVDKMNDASQSRDTRVSCIEVLSAFDERAIVPLLQALNDEVLAEKAASALRDRGNELLPRLLAGREDEASFTPEAREAIGGVIEDMFAGLGGAGDMVGWAGGHALVQRESLFRKSVTASGGAMAQIPTAEARQPIVIEPAPVENAMPVEVDRPTEPEPELATLRQPPIGYKTVEVHYGTNRKATDPAVIAAVGRRRWFWLLSVGTLVLVIVYLVYLYRRGAKRQATAGLAGTTLLLLLGLIVFAPTRLRPAIEKIGPQYGGEYTDHIDMGVCEVTIPDTHREGETEGPSIIRWEVDEDLQKHIVLRRVRRMESDEFFGSLRRKMQHQGNHLLVFIHGYNVSFEDAARRTAQMSSDLKFAGAPVFYSWPSQADWMKYRVDEKNVELSVDQLKEFLLAIAKRSDADSINLVAHSMGNRVLTDALKEIDVATTEREQLFNQVILAAPDIDADIFKQRIAPAIVTKAKHITLYASSRDRALVVSRTFNSGDPRAGDAGESLVVVPGIETIDVSSGDSSLLGHSYYGDNVSVLQDIEFLLRDQPAHARRFLEPMAHQGDLIYWLFMPDRVSRRIDQYRDSR